MKKILAVVGGLFAVLLVGLGGFVGIKMASADFQRDAPYPDIKASTDPAVIKRGEYVAHHVAHCSTCHQAAENVQAFKIDADRGIYSAGLRRRAP